MTSFHYCLWTFSSSILRVVSEPPPSTRQNYTHRNRLSLISKLLREINKAFVKVNIASKKRLIHFDITKAMDDTPKCPKKQLKINQCMCWIFWCNMVGWNVFGLYQPILSLSNYLSHQLSPILILSLHLSIYLSISLILSLY